MTGAKHVSITRVASVNGEKHVFAIMPHEGNVEDMYHDS